MAYLIEYNILHLKRIKLFDTHKAAVRWCEQSGREYLIKTIKPIEINS